MSRKVAIFVPEGAQLVSIAAPTDLLQLANRFARERTGETGAATRQAGAHVACHWLSLRGKPVALSCGASLPVDAGIDQDTAYDAVFVGAFEPADDDALTRHLQGAAALSAWLRRQHRDGALIAAYGSGVFLLAEAGLLDGRAATAPWWQQQFFHRRYPAVKLDASQGISEDAGLLCAGALAGLMPLALRLAQRLTSPNTADWLANTTLVDPAPAPDLPRAALSQPGAAGDALVAAAQHHLQQRYAEKSHLADLARTLAVSPRTLSRRFHDALGISPQAYVQLLRIEAAKQMLLRTSLRIERISRQVGYGDTGFFKRLFRSHTSLSPSAWRARETAAAAHRTTGEEHAGSP